MRCRALPLPLFRRRIARRTRARLLARHMLRLLLQGDRSPAASALSRVRSEGTPLLSRLSMMLLRSHRTSRPPSGATTLPH
ncbi:MAG TPA: hypothetical protein VN581_11575 [Patescibacteria group bacterium]|nr:hypothetical protein [Patescibacteria group bacterium]